MGAAAKHALFSDDKRNFLKVFEKTRLAFFAPIRPYLNDPSVSEIMINGPDQIYVERKACSRSSTLASRARKR